MHILYIEYKQLEDDICHQLVHVWQNQRLDGYEKPPNQDGFCEVSRRKRLLDSLKRSGAISWRKTLLDSQKSLGRDILERITPGLAKIARGLELGDLRVFRKS